MEKFPHTYRMDLAFNGSNYGGWQRQTDGTLSVQEVVENVLRLQAETCTFSSPVIRRRTFSTTSCTERVPSVCRCQPP